jgi:hypothetical protein
MADETPEKNTQRIVEAGAQAMPRIIVVSAQTTEAPETLPASDPADGGGPPVNQDGE